MDSRQAAVAASGAVQNIRTYLNDTLANVHTIFNGPNEYVSETLGVLPVVVYSSLAALAAVSLTMSRYGWSRGTPSPYSSMSGGVPNVTDEDFSYITSQDLDESSVGASADSRHPRPDTSSPPGPDDLLLIKNKGITYPAHFPAYSIGDGKLRVKDVKDRVGLLMDLSDRTTRRIKLLYKGQQMKEPAAPVRNYGVKNKSEIMAVVPEGADASSPSEEEMVVVGGPEQSKSQRRRKNRSKKKAQEKSANSNSSHRDSNSNADAPSTPGSQALRQLEELSAEFRNNWQPLCAQFIASPPGDETKRDDEHRRISESVMQHILLKLDGVDTDGDPDIRARRKLLVREVQDALKKIDAAKASSRK